jgi:pimeloyl-ACP methyl ester carboxylesterase
LSVIYTDSISTGFPDSFLLWRHILQSPELSRNNVLIAVDLPGYGGSDSLLHYGPYEMLEAITEFILDMRRQYLQEDKRVVVTTHDWGALVGSRLASEAAQLADHWIITSGMIVRDHRTASMSHIANTSIATSGNFERHLADVSG